MRVYFGESAESDTNWNYTFGSFETFGPFGRFVLGTVASFTGPNEPNVRTTRTIYSLDSPTLNRTKRLTVMFSPVLALVCATSWAMVTLGSRTDGWSSSTTWE